MRNLLAFIAAICVCAGALAQQVEYTVSTNDPDWSHIPNLYVSPVLTLDAPFSNDGLNSSTFGWGVRTHAIVRGRFFADVNYMSSLWNIVSRIDKKPRLLEVGGTLLKKSSVTERTIPVVLSRKELSSVRYGDKVRTTEEVKYIDVPNGKELRFSGVRGGLYTFRSIFDYAVPGVPPAGTNYHAPDENVRGWTHAFGVYGGLTMGSVTNLHIKSNKRNYSTMRYTRWFADLMVTGLSHHHIEDHETNDRNAFPIGFRVGFDTTNKTVTGAFAKAIHAEVGYRPGFNGFYFSMSFSFVQIRSSVLALM